MHGTIHLGPRHLPLLLHLTQTRFVSDCPSRSSPFLAVTGMNGPCFNTAEARYPRRPSYSVHVRRFPLRCFDKLNRTQIKLNEHIYASLSIHRDNAKKKKKKKKKDVMFYLVSLVVVETFSSRREKQRRSRGRDRTMADCFVLIKAFCPLQEAYFPV